MAWNVDLQFRSGMGHFQIECGLVEFDGTDTSVQITTSLTQVKAGFATEARNAAATDVTSFAWDLTTNTLADIPEFDLTASTSTGGEIKLHRTIEGGGTNATLLVSYILIGL